jgi:glycerol-1-phosphate dehydrogenase [NAD(P)+]
MLWHSGIGDLTSKFTAVSDWKLAFHRRGVPVNDLAALISDASVFQFMANPRSDEQGIRLLAKACRKNYTLQNPDFCGSLVFRGFGG